MPDRNAGSTYRLHCPLTGNFGVRSTSDWREFDHSSVVFMEPGHGPLPALASRPCCMHKPHGSVSLQHGRAVDLRAYHAACLTSETLLIQAMYCVSAKRTLALKAPLYSDVWIAYVRYDPVTDRTGRQQNRRLGRFRFPVNSEHHEAVQRGSP